MIDLAKMTELSIGGVKLRELSVSGVKVWQAGRLPAGYTEVEYIHTDGNCYFDTGVIPSDFPDGIRIDLDFKITQYITDNVYTYYFGCKTSGCYSNCFAVNSSAGNLRAYVGSSVAYTYKWVAVLNQRTLISMTSTTEDPHGTMASLKIDGAEKLVVNTKNNTNPTTMPGVSIHLLNSNGSGRKGVIGECYGSAMFTADGTPLREFVPCTNESGVAGMYDLVSKSFYSNQGTGTLTSGPAV